MNYSLNRAYPSPNNLKRTFQDSTPALFFVLQELHNYKYNLQSYPDPMLVQGAKMAIQLQKLAGESLQKLAVKVGVDPNQAAAMATDNLIPLIIGSAARQSGALHLLADITGQLHGRAESNIKINWAI